MFEFFIRAPARVWALQQDGALSNRTTLVVGSPPGGLPRAALSALPACNPATRIQALIACAARAPIELKLRRSCHPPPPGSAGERLPQFAAVLLKPFTPFEVVSFSEVGQVVAEIDSA